MKRCERVELLILLQFIKNMFSSFFCYRRKGFKKLFYNQNLTHRFSIYFHRSFMAPASMNKLISMKMLYRHLVTKQE